MQPLSTLISKSYDYLR
ncbi:Protein of unknown function [Pyronema omphalodes CBS 100304]|uniref:Uncharacterized protein n=1 Tax=Pyronema omphalodes (strain CBS 100304) TaxID=1076935 RepID=U4L9W2_PYROM|nr:Protein of unknown function [Pyronema omphalodes CBS 100304]